MGRTNIDVKTGIHYGVIARNSVSPDIEMDAAYGSPHCPGCGREVKAPADYPYIDFDGPEWTHRKYECDDFVCFHCKTVFGGESAYPYEPIGCSFNHNGYVVELSGESYLVVLKSPYWTMSTYCSPCYPGAGDLATPGDDCKTYCLGPEWFNDEKPPYTFYYVSTNKLAD
jgi:hypothetical protein